MQVFQPSNDIYVTPENNFSEGDLNNSEYIGEVLLIGVDQSVITNEDGSQSVKTDTYFLTRWLGVTAKAEFFSTDSLVTLSDELVNHYVFDEADDESEYEEEEEEQQYNGYHGKSSENERELD